MASHVEIKKSVPIARNVDVLVAGAGIAGCNAAIAAARTGAKTMLIDRFGSLGGNMGPGLIGGGGVDCEMPVSLRINTPGVLGEFLSRCRQHCDTTFLHHYFRDSEVISYVWLKMMEEENVELMLNVYSADPIMEGDDVKGLIVETKSGALAIMAKVLIDTTGDADVAYRAGAPIYEGNVSCFEAGIYFALGHVDVDRFHTQVLFKDPPQDVIDWGANIDPLVVWRYHCGSNKQLLPYQKKAWEAGDYKFIETVPEYGNVRIIVDHGIFDSVVNHVPNPISRDKYQIVGAMAGVYGVERAMVSGDVFVMTGLEVACRKYIFKTSKFLKKWMPGFEESYLHMISPFFHARGGRSMISEYACTHEDTRENTVKDDVVFRYYGFPYSHKDVDFPYRQLLPQKIGNLLAAGRSAIIQGPCFRIRWMVFMMGNVAGAAAGLAVKNNVAPRELDVKELQKVLYTEYQLPFGDETRLRELGLVT